jgi:hypothetical protein
VYLPANADLAINFLFKLVNGGLNLGACNSEGRLKFKQDGCACADHCLDSPGIVHEWRLAWMENNPGCDKRSNDNPEGEVVAQFWFVRKQHEARGDCQHNGNYEEGIFSNEQGHKTLWRANVMFYCDGSHFDNSIEFFYNRATCPSALLRAK